MKYYLFLICLIFSAVFAFGQTDNPDAKVAEFFGKFSYWSFLLIPICMAITQGIKTLLPKVPTWLLPYIVPFLGAGVDFLANKLGLWTGNTAAAAVISGLSVYVHQLYKQPVKEANGENDK